jgi:polyketide synthase PksN
LEAGTGMPMLFKVIEILKHKKIPAQINIAALNEDVDWNKINAKVTTETIDWKNEDGKPLRAAINLSGYSGTNVHMIFEEAKQKSNSDEINAPLHFVLSAKDTAALKNIAQKYLNESDWQENTLTEICYTLQKARNHFDYSLSIIANDKQAIIDGLNDFVQDIKLDKYVVSNPELNRNKEIAFFIYRTRCAVFWHV